MSPAGVKNVFQTKDMKFVNTSVPWQPSHHAMIPQLVEKQLNTEQVGLLCPHAGVNIKSRDILKISLKAKQYKKNPKHVKQLFIQNDLL